MGRFVRAAGDGRRETHLSGSGSMLAVPWWQPFRRAPSSSRLAAVPPPMSEGAPCVGRVAWAALRFRPLPRGRPPSAGPCRSSFPRRQPGAIKGARATAVPKSPPSGCRLPGPFERGAYSGKVRPAAAVPWKAPRHSISARSLPGGRLRSESRSPGVRHFSRPERKTPAAMAGVPVVSGLSGMPELSGPRHSCSRAARRRHTAGADGRSSVPDRPAFPSTARSSRRCATVRRSA